MMMFHLAPVQISELLRRAGINAHKELIWRMRKREGLMVAQAENFGDEELAVHIYEAFLALPQTATAAELSVEGFKLNGPLIGNSDKVTICYKSEPNGSFTIHVLKSLSAVEWTRGVQFKEAIGSARHPGVITFSLHRSASNKEMMIMPYYPCTVEPVPDLAERELNQLWDQVSCALSFIHSHGFVHMDIKPSNICIDQNGLYILIDLGSVVPFGMKSSSTMCYLPSDMQPAAGETSLVADQSVDWWMLAMVIAEKGGRAQPGSGPRRSEPRREILLTLLTDYILGKLLVKLNPVILK